MLEYIGVSKNFGKIQALKEVSLLIREGDFVFITGPSGAGKTTLLKLLLREYKPSSGEILFDGVKVHELKRKSIPVLRQSVGSIFQDFLLLPNKTVIENIRVALAIKKVAKKHWKTRVDNVLNLVGLADRGYLFPSQLSGGELQRAAIARALVTNPKVIFADEPTGNLDWETSEKIMTLLKKINDEGKTVIIATHNKNIVSKLGKRVIDIRGGKVVHDSNPPRRTKKPQAKKKK